MSKFIVPAARMGRLPRALALAALALSSILAALACLEALFWLRPLPVGRAGIYTDDDLLNHAYLPGHAETRRVHPDIPPHAFRTNGLGLRIDEPYPVAKPAGVKRLLVIGDSFVDGLEWSTTLPARLERRLAPLLAGSGSALHAVHAGVGSYSPMLHYFALKTKLLDLQPDLVVLAIDLTDARDDWEDYRPLLYRGADGEPAGVHGGMAANKESLRAAMAAGLPRASPDRWIAWGAGWSRFAGWLFDRQALAYAYGYGRLFPRPAYRIAGDALLDLGNPDTRTAVDYSLSWVARIHDLLRERGIPFVIAMYPWRQQLEQPGLRAYFGPYEDFAARRGIPFHNALPAFEGVAPAGAYLRDDIHFNLRGQEIWGDSLGAFLEPRLPGLLGLRRP